MGDFAKGLKLTGHEVNKIDSRYSLNRIKTSQVHYQANELNCFFDNAKGQKMQITFRVSNNDVAFRYTLFRQGDTGSVRVMNENTGFAFPEKPEKSAFRFAKSIRDGFNVTFSLVRKSNQKRRFTFFLLLQKEPKSSRGSALRPRFKTRAVGF